MSNRFVIVSGDKEGVVEIADDAVRAAAQFKDEKRLATGQTIGAELWSAMNASGVNRDHVNHFAIYEGDRSGTLIATIQPVMHGNHATWLVLYRANKDATCFRTLCNRHRVGDALDAAFAKASEEIVMPHKP
jgi:hypothetical protein